MNTIYGKNSARVWLRWRVVASITMIGVALLATACENNTPPAPAAKPAPPTAPTPAAVPTSTPAANAQPAATPTAPLMPPPAASAAGAAPAAKPNGGASAPSADDPPLAAETDPSPPAAPAEIETRKWRETWPNGKAKAFCLLVRDPKTEKWVKHGLWQSWNEDGTINKEGHYVYDKQDGDWKFYFPNVPQPIIEVYQMGRKVPTPPRR